MATAIYIIVQDAGSNYVSLLNQLGVKKSELRFETTASQVDENNLLREITLVHERMGFVSGQPFAEHVPAFLAQDPSASKRTLRYQEWWLGEAIYREPHIAADGKNKPFTLTRHKLTSALRNQEGGAHFDPNPDDPNFERLTREGLTVPKFVVGNQATSIMLAELACMRQISWELSGALDRLGLS